MWNRGGLQNLVNATCERAIFQQAMNNMALLDKACALEIDSLAAYQRVIKTISIEALNENAAWLQLHRMNAYQVQVS
ncbi:hypothetical protein Q4574_12315 [Aliiglaciecola sp. 3_MG-2023]|uniref:hypothetical protein n=1 Tax=Aliiglaciecola sp. 3_MG-2023 TaxID=3062644 RepID=UPI0026E48358|nr:hypothetical protein [Aliiglaciecola sp. 3_MG-2023]MDO6694067.1 hypothetical protein [Aliiglaciecola sp. 3_MG-2023]